MTIWQNFPVYLVIGGGQQPQWQPAPGLSLFVAGAFLRLVIFNITPPVIEQHFMISQVVALAICCDAPEFPFSEAFWNILFGMPTPPAPGGLMIGGGDDTGRFGKGGLKIGGKGIVSIVPWDMLLEDKSKMLVQDFSDMLLETDLFDAMLLEDFTAMDCESFDPMALE